MCVVENAGFGATYAAPIVSLMIEKYLKDSITNPARLAKIEQLYRTSLIPARILAEMRRLDSVAAAKKQQTDQEAKRRMKELKDSTGIDEDPDAAPAEPVRKMPGTPAPKQKNNGKTVFYHETLDQRKRWTGLKATV
jgi:penicillin-binding protein 2